MFKLLQKVRSGIPLLALLLIATVAFSQQTTFKEGVRQGAVKVKFASTMTTTLSAMPSTMRVQKGQALVTGIAPFDGVAKQTSAYGMERLFPYNPKTEHKLRKHGLHLWYVVSIDENTDPKMAALVFSKLSEVQVAEVQAEKTLSPSTVTEYSSGVQASTAAPFNDPLLPDQWHYQNDGQTGNAGMDVNLYEAWTTTTGANDIVVSVHDMGVDVEHEDLAGNMWVNEAEMDGVDGVDDDGNGYVDDIHGYNFDENQGAIDPQFHATHVAGTIAAVNDNGIGVSGIAGGDGSGNGVKIMSMQSLGGGLLEKTFVYAADNGAVISQNSWGYTNPGSYEQSVMDAIDYFIEEAGDYEGSPMKGGIVIFAAGNSDYDGEWYPGFYDGTLSVAALTPTGTKASYSNYGEWVDIAAPGGEMGWGSENGVLSTLPDNAYGYLEGTSMACPHVSGIAALALANRTSQMIPEELWQKLVTGVNSIEDINPGYENKLGSGAIDAALALKNDVGIVPDKITDLQVTGVAQEFMNLEWTVPSDEDDDTPLLFTIYYGTEPITDANKHLASTQKMANSASSGSTVTYELVDLLGFTEYYVAVTSSDRWGNESVVSNVESETTNNGPAIAVDPASESITLDIDINTSTTASHDITILNEDEGVLRWDNMMRHRSTSLSYSTAGMAYPVVTKTKSPSEANIALHSATPSNAIRGNEVEASAFTQITKEYTSWVSNIIGETDTSFTNSSATRFYVDEAEGFNLTQTQIYTYNDPAKGPMIVEVYAGNSPSKENLVYAQEYTGWGYYETWSYVTFDEQLYFESGSTFWIVAHMPSGNLFPLGMGPEINSTDSDNCFMSLDMGATWSPLNEAINDNNYAWATRAVSQNAHLGTYITLDPGNGDVAGMSDAMTTLTADGSNLINGNYGANVILTSNDPNNPEYRIPVTVNVTGHPAKLNVPDIVNYGSTFIGETNTIEIVLDNVGYGNMNSPSYTFADGSNFSINGSSPWQLKAREQYVLKVDFVPTSSGNANDILTITNGTYTYEIALFGVGAETSEITVTPDNQTVPSLTIGDVVNAQLTVENTGGYPLKYFIPGYDDAGVSDDWPTNYHSYGYKFRTNYASETSPLTYDFQDISSTGVDITSQLTDDAAYFELDMGFDFPYYGQNMSTIYVAQKGFTTFDNSVRPINNPRLNGSPWSPKGYISPLGGYVDFSLGGAIYYKKEADRIIIQYHEIADGSYDETWSFQATITAQMVLHANGDIRFYYDNNTYSANNQKYFNIMIEDVAQTDGILIHDYENNVDLSAGTALGFDYPGPNIITDIQNGSGIIMPGQSKVVDVTLNTSSLVEGTTNRYVNIVSNDPANSSVQPLIALDIVAGGTAMPVLSATDFDFGDVFQGAVRTETLRIKNEGTADVDITSLVVTGGNFTVDGDQPTSITPGLYKDYTITIPTSSIASLTDDLTITYGDASTDVLSLTGNVVDAPAINVDLSLVQQTLDYGETAAVAYSIENTGLADLEIMTQGQQWVSFDADGTTPDSVSYHYEMYNSSADGVYNWIDIRETGTKLPAAEDIFNPEDYWRDYTLPFEFEYYGEKYTSIKIGENGIVSFDADPEVMAFNEGIPTTGYEGRFIMPYWTFASLGTLGIPEDDFGLFYQEYDDKVIITWSYLVNWFGGMGAPVSTQLFMYKNGTMKFQYQVETIFGGDDQTSNFTSIGVQGSSTNSIAISDHNNLNHGDGLAYVLVPTKQLTIASGSTISGNINFDAQNVFGGVYNADLGISTNVPGSEMLAKPVELTVNGTGEFSNPVAIDFGNVMVETDQWGTPIQNYMEIEVTNTGSASLDITSIAMADGAQSLSLQVWAEIWGWFGPEWTWVDITDTWNWTNPTITLNPGNMLEARAVFSPTASGSFTDDITFTTSLGDYTTTLSGSSFLPPAMTVVDTPINETMNERTESISKSINIDNALGQSDLNYEVAIEFGRAVTSHESVSTTNIPGVIGQAEALINSNAVEVSSTYNRTLQYGSDTEPDALVGVGATFPVATMYNSGAEGFNLTHVESYFSYESLHDATITLEVRAGGSTIANSAVIGTGTLQLDESADDTGSWKAIMLDEPVFVYPNEDFYVIVKYPFGIDYPQGVVNGAEQAEGRFLYGYEDVWYDLQNESGYTESAWLMYAAEETPASVNPWLSITSALTGTLAAGESTTIDLVLDGLGTERGDNIANIVVTGNDPANPKVSVPVSLHMNEAPMYLGMDDMYEVAEMGTLNIVLEVVDPESNTFDVVSASSYAGVTYSLVGNELAIEYRPTYGDSGMQEFTFVATDEYGAVNESTILVDVAHTNQAPEFVDPAMTFEYNEVGMYSEYVFADMFTDPDGDEMTYSIMSSDGAVAEAYATGSNFIIQTATFGQTSVVLTATDSNGASTSQEVVVDVTEIANDAPVFNDPSMVFEYEGVDTYTEHNFNDYFTDPDGDDMTFTVTSDDTSLAEVYVTGEIFMVKTMAIGTDSLTLTATDVLGATTTQKVAINVTELVLAADESLATNGVSLYPNPVQTTVNLVVGNEFGNNLKVSVVDASGRLYFEQKHELDTSNRELAIDMSELSSGIYIVNVKSDDQLKMIRIVKQ